MKRARKTASICEQLISSFRIAIAGKSENEREIPQTSSRLCVSKERKASNSSGVPEIEGLSVF